VQAAQAQRQYRAFISYSHADRDAARWLHRALETYRLPSRLVGRPGPRGEIPAGLDPIFKDREDLPAANDLTAEVSAALQASGCLVVLCTPAAAASRYVEQEIALFRAAHPDRPILAALFAGEPDAAFPAALRRLADGSPIEPLAADFRKAGDGKRLALLKIVAGVAGVDLDALVQRDAQRRLRRVTAITVAAVIAMLVMALLTAFALRARAEAVRQRAEAEGLVEFMLTDLRDRLKGVGRLDAMTSTNARAMAYYSGQALDQLGPVSLERRARILLAMGADNERLGDLAAARRNYAEAKRVTVALRLADPGNPDRIFADAQSDYWRGHVDELAGNFDAAAIAYGRYRAAAQALLALEPGSARALAEIAYAENNLGVLELNGFRRPARAITAFTAATTAFAAALRQQPGNAGLRFETANAHAWLADACFATGDLAAARRNRLIDRALKIELLADDPQNRRYAFAIIVSDRAVALIDIASGDRRRAATTLAGAAAGIAALVTLDPANMMWREQAAHIALDRARLDLDDRAAVVELLHAARAGLIGSDGAVPAEKDGRDLLALIDSMLAMPAPNRHNRHPTRATSPTGTR
jgi:hypothetical protein